MLNGLCGQRNFYKKCKMALKMINLRMDQIMKKRNAMQKFLKNDIADLLRNNLDYNAYGRAEGLYMELNLSSCYNYVQECCKHVSDQLKSIHKERECPEDCRIAVASIIHAASRFSDLLELRDIRTMFNDKYGELNSLDIYVSKEFVEKLKSNPPTMEMKLQLMKDIAKEFFVEWESMSLEREINNNSTPEQVLFHDQYTRGESYKLDRAMSNDVLLEKEALIVDKRVIPTPYVKPTIDDHREDDDKSNSRQGECQSTLKSVRSRFTKRPENDMEPRNENCSKGNKDEEFELKDTLNVKHLHPMIPDYDELASRIQALSNK